MANTADRLLYIVKSAEFTLLVIAFMIYMSNPGVLLHTDVSATRLLPISVIRERNYDLNEFKFLYNSTDNLPYYLKNIDGRILSQYPVFTAVLATPIYLIPVLAGLDPQSNNVLLLAKISAALMTAISSLFIYWTIKRIASEKTALITTIIYAFGTANWPISSQDLWQHGPGELFIAITIYLLVRGLKEEKYIKYAGLTTAMAVAIRPPNAVIALVLSAYVLMEHRKQSVKYLLYATPIALAVMAYSQTYLHSILLMGQIQPPAERWDNPMLDGVAGLLISPNRGLLAYTPAFILALPGILSAWRRRDAQMKYYSIAAILAILMWSKWYAWHGEITYGPRMLIETFPFLCVLMAGPVERMLEKRHLIFILAALAALSFLINFVGVSEADGSWNWKHNLEENVNKDDREYLSGLWWNTNDMEWVYYTKKFFARFYVNDGIRQDG